MNRLILGDSLQVLSTLEENSIDSLVTDPPAGIAFMGKDWDNHNKYQPITEKANQTFEFLVSVGDLEAWEAGFVAFTVDWASLALKALKPGAHGLVWALPRTSDLTGLGLRLAGFEIRENVYHLFGSGFPKSHDISKAIDAMYGAERKDAIKGGHMGISTGGGDRRNENAQQWHVKDMHGQIDKGRMTRGTPATDEAKKWSGWGTALKPAAEEWILIRKPFTGTVAANVLQWGIGGINIDACRVPINDGATMARNNKPGSNDWKNSSGGMNSAALHGEPNGRWPANTVHDGSDVIVDQFPETGKSKAAHRGAAINGNIFLAPKYESTVRGHDDNGGSAARFFYCAKPDDADRNEGLERFEQVTVNDGRKTDIDNPYQSGTTLRNNPHPTVKSTELMRWLTRLVTPEGGTVLDPFMGSGSTGKACNIEGFDFIGIEREEIYFQVAKCRIEATNLPLFVAESVVVTESASQLGMFEE